jgi:hypothetical protein
MGCNSFPLLLERVGERRIKSTVYIPLIPAFSLEGEGAYTGADAHAWKEREQDVKVNSCTFLNYIE